MIKIKAFSNEKVLRKKQIFQHNEYQRIITDSKIIEHTFMCFQ